MKFTDVEVRGGTITARVELDPKVDGATEMALGRALAEKMPYFTSSGRAHVMEGQSGISIQAEVAENDFDRLQDAAAEEQRRFVELIQEAKHTWRILCVIERSKDYNREGLKKQAEKSSG